LTRASSAPSTSLSKVKETAQRRHFRKKRFEMRRTKLPASNRVIGENEQNEGFEQAVDEGVVHVKSLERSDGF
jgi:hypothetical protein